MSAIWFRGKPSTWWSTTIARSSTPSRRNARSSSSRSNRPGSIVRSGVLDERQLTDLDGPPLSDATCLSMTCPHQDPVQPGIESIGVAERREVRQEATSASWVASHARSGSRRISSAMP